MYILIVVILIIFLMNNKCEGYQDNKPPSDTPDDMQFYACHDYSNNKITLYKRIKTLLHSIVIALIIYIFIICLNKVHIQL